MIILLMYLAVLLFTGVFYFKWKVSLTDFLTAGGRQGTWMVVFSLLATMLGASATFGVLNRAYLIGFPAFWWLGAGGIGLILQSILLSGKVKQFQASTLSDLVEETMGKEVSVLVSVIIVISWTGIIAAQFVALSQAFHLILGTFDVKWILPAAGITAVLYTFLGGQDSIIKTDFIQFMILAAALAVISFFIFPVSVEEPFHIQLTSLDFPVFDLKRDSLVIFLFLTGGAYFAGPDLFTRLFAAKDASTAVKSVIISGIILILFGLLLALIGLKSSILLPLSEYSVRIESQGLIPVLLKEYIPQWASILFGFGLLSAMISSLDTCLVTSSGIMAKNILGLKSSRSVRGMILIIGFLALLTALFQKNIIGLLFYAYSVYTPGVVMPLTVGIYAYPDYPVRHWAPLTAVAVGGILGLISNFTGLKILALAGMALSFLIAVFPLYQNKLFRNHQS